MFDDLRSLKVLLTPELVSFSLKFSRGEEVPRSPVKAAFPAQPLLRSSEDEESLFVNKFLVILLGCLWSVCEPQN